MPEKHVFSGYEVLDMGIEKDKTGHSIDKFKSYELLIDDYKPIVVVTEITKNAAAVELGRRGGLKGGIARAEKLSPERRKEIAKIAAEKRWNK